MSAAVRRQRRTILVACAMVSWITLSILMTVMAQQSDGVPEEKIWADDEKDLIVKPVEQPPAETVPATDEIVPSDDEELKAENVLAGDEAKPAEAVDIENEDLTSAAIPGETQPILRLDFEGHTGTIRTLDLAAGGQTMVTAGEDKDVHFWRRADIGDTGWLHQKTIRWPITRGPRGLVYTASLRGDLVAFAGHGAFGGAGEIRVSKAASGSLDQTLVDQHRQVILSLAWAPGETQRLASIDMEGRLILWTRDPANGLWTPQTLVENDIATYGEAGAVALKPHRTFAPISFSGANHLVVPRCVALPVEAKDPAGAAVPPNWHLARIDLRDNTTKLLTELDHFGHVVAIDSTPDGRVLASCEYWSGSIALWTFDDQGESTVKKFNPEKPPLFIDLDPSGKRLLLGTEVLDIPEGGEPRLQLWDIEADPPQLLSQRLLSAQPRGGAIDLERKEAIVAQASHVEVYSFDEAGKFSDATAKKLTVPVKPVLKVAFTKKNDEYKIAFGTGRDAEGKKTLDGVFDLSASKLLGRSAINPDDFFSSQRTDTPWQIPGLPVQTDDGPRYPLYEGDQRRGFLPFQAEKHGLPSTICTLPKPATGVEEPEEKPATGAVIVGTSGRNDIYVYAPDASDPPTLLRHFRGHSGKVLSVATSADGKYLVSGAEDSTIAVWNLQDLFTASESVNRWGVEFELDGDQLIAAEVREDGPLYFRGVRDGDRLASIEWADEKGDMTAESNADKIFDRLLTLPFDEMVVFRFTRFGRARPGFQSYPAWWPLATLFVDQTREWAFWTPAGYYDASFNGHQRFGWQINKGIGANPDFFRAAQFRKLLERPPIMRRLLAAGSLPAAMRQSISGIGPAEGHDAIVTQYHSKPKIELIKPLGGEPIHGDSLIVQAKISVPLGATLIDPKAFVSGVPPISQRVIATPDASDDSNEAVVADGADAADESGGAGETGIADEAVTYEWEFRLPSDKLLQLEVIAATEAEALDRVMIDLEHTVGDAPKAKPRLHVLAIGASKYPDPQILSLDFAATNAGNVTELFRKNSSSIYRITTDQLVDADATRPLWRAFAQQAAEQLSATVSPDDLVIMYLCGHGLRDRLTNQWYFVTADARYSDLMNDQYADCLAFSDLAALSSLPCRKLAILDSCHSGAVQPLMDRNDLKSVLRFLQDDVVLTVTASEGDEEAAEEQFTVKLLAALEGAADANQDKVVTLTEMIDYVTRAVTDESESEKMPQHPTASPRYLLRTLQLPLTTVPSP